MPKRKLEETHLKIKTWKEIENLIRGIYPDLNNEKDYIEFRGRRKNFEWFIVAEVYQGYRSYYIIQEFTWVTRSYAVPSYLSRYSRIPEVQIEIEKKVWDFISDLYQDLEEDLEDYCMYEKWFFRKNYLESKRMRLEGRIQPVPNYPHTIGMSNDTATTRMRNLCHKDSNPTLMSERMRRTQSLEEDHEAVRRDGRDFQPGDVTP